MRQIDQSHAPRMQRLDLNPGQSDVTHVRLPQGPLGRTLGHLLKASLTPLYLVSTEDGEHSDSQAKVGVANLTKRRIGFIPVPPRARHGNTWSVIPASGEVEEGDTSLRPAWATL